MSAIIQKSFVDGMTIQSMAKFDEASQPSYLGRHSLGADPGLRHNLCPSAPVGIRNNSISPQPGIPLCLYAIASAGGRAEKSVAAEKNDNEIVRIARNHSIAISVIVQGSRYSLFLHRHKMSLCQEH